MNKERKRLRRLEPGFRPVYGDWKREGGFTLMELLVVLGIIAVLGALLFPVLGQARAKSWQQQCASNLRQLFTANTLYAADHGYYAAAAADMVYPGENLQRWHGVRPSVDEPYDSGKGLLAPYLGESKEIHRCRAFQDFRVSAADNAFESSSGGYGYNIRGVGSQVYLDGATYTKGMKPFQIRRPVHTVMFTDAAFAQPYGNPTYLIEPSFAEAYYFVNRDKEEEYPPAQPTIHFRHNGQANVVWCDGHISREEMTVEYNDTFTRFHLGWFGGPNNELFDPY